MERKLRKYDRDRGESWLNYAPHDLLERVLDEYIECRLAFKHGRLRSAQREAVDIANFAMMVFNTLNKKLTSRYIYIHESTGTSSFP